MWGVELANLIMRRREQPCVNSRSHYCGTKASAVSNRSRCTQGSEHTDHAVRSKVTLTSSYFRDTLCLALLFHFYFMFSLHFFTFMCVCVFVSLESMSELTKGKDLPTVQESCDIKVIMAAKQFCFYFLVTPAPHWSMLGCVEVCVLFTQRCRKDTGIDTGRTGKTEKMMKKYATPDGSKHSIQANVHQVHGGARCDRVYKARLMDQWDVCVICCFKNPLN